MTKENTSRFDPTLSNGFTDFDPRGPEPPARTEERWVNKNGQMYAVKVRDALDGKTLGEVHEAARQQHEAGRAQRTEEALARLSRPYDGPQEDQLLLPAEASPEHESLLHKVASELATTAQLFHKDKQGR